LITIIVEKIVEALAMRSASKLDFDRLFEMPSEDLLKATKEYKQYASDDFQKSDFHGAIKQ